NWPSDQPLLLPHRGILQITGHDSAAFLQGLISNDMGLVAEQHMIYAALATPQGKFLHDLFVSPCPQGFWLEAERARLDELSKLLKRYALRADVVLEQLPHVQVYFSVHALMAAEKMFADPRHEKMGYRFYASQPLPHITDISLYDRHRLPLAAPDGSRDVRVGDDFLLEANIDVLNGISFTKGCYMGQEMTARMHYRAKLKYRLQCITLGDYTLSPDHTLFNTAGKKVGDARLILGDIALAMLAVDAEK
ncbi:MAG: folate-binding protein, partial [Alphaproteobacteria bacterium]|nr:folate-binding protein [Alphaproteobacteria bacterium]